MNNDFVLPNWEVLPPRSNQVTAEVYLDWLAQEREELVAAGQLEEIRSDPVRCPVNVRFRWEETRSEN